MTVIVLLMLLAADAQQHDAHATDAPKPATLTKGLGRLHHPITKSADAARRLLETVSKL